MSQTSTPALAGDDKVSSGINKRRCSITGVSEII